MRSASSAAGDEREHLRGDAIEPLRILDEADQRLLLGSLGQQAQHRQSHEETIRRAATRSPNATCSASRCGAGSEPIPSSIGAHR